MSWLVTEISAIYNILSPDSNIWQLWSNTLLSGAFKPGRGLLRNADDEYDPMGVLITLQSDHEWKWSSVEEAWSIDGDAYVLSMARLAKCLEIKAQNDAMLGRLQTILQEEADNGQTLSEIGEMLTLAAAYSAQDERRMFYVDPMQYAPTISGRVTAKLDTNFYRRT